MRRGLIAPLLWTQNPPQVEPGPSQCQLTLGLIPALGLTPLLCLYLGVSISSSPSGDQGQSCSQPRSS